MKSTKTFFLAITVVLLSVFTTSCIPNLPSNGTVSPSNIYILQNKTIPPNNLGNYLDSVGIDVNNDLVYDFYLIRNNGNLGSIYLDPSINTEFAGTSDSFPSYYKIFNLNELVSSSNNWSRFQYGTLFSPNVIGLGGSSIIPNNNLTGSGLFGFRIKNGINYNYGWTKIAFNMLPLSPSIITVVETTYSTTTNQSIKAGIK